MTETATTKPALRPARAVLGRGSPWPIFGITLRSILWTKRTPLLLLVLLIPMGLSLAIGGVLRAGDYSAIDGGLVPPGQDGRYWFADSTIMIYLGVLLPLIVAYLATRLIGDEVANKTLPYLFVRPVPRWVVFLAKFAGFYVATVLLAVVAIVPHFFIAVGATQNPWDALGEFMAIVGILALAVLANGALFAFMGVAVRFPLVFAVAYFFLWENVFGSFPAEIKRLTLLFYERSLVAAAADRDGLAGSFLGLDVEPWPAVLVLLGVAAVFLAAACVVVSRKDYNV